MLEETLPQVRFNAMPQASKKTRRYGARRGDAYQRQTRRMRSSVELGSWRAISRASIAVSRRRTSRSAATISSSFELKW